MANKSLTAYLQEKKESNQLIFVPYIMAGANGLENLQEEINTLIKNGATAIELGIPFSDPVADGPVIQAAGLSSLSNGTTFKKIIKTLQEIKSEVPLILMGYTNSFFHYGFCNLVKDLQTTDVRGLIIPDLPYEHLGLLAPFIENSDLALIPLVTLTSSEERIKTVTEKADGFVYAVTVKGVTGVGKNYQTSLDEHLQKVVEISPIPVLAGFGISTTEDVNRFFNVCDGVVVGSKIVTTLANEGVEEAGKLVANLTFINN